MTIGEFESMVNEDGFFDPNKEEKPNESSQPENINQEKIENKTDESSQVKEETELSELKEQNSKLLKILETYQIQKPQSQPEQIPETKKQDIYKNDSFKNLMTSLNVDEKDNHVFVNFFKDYQSKVKQEAIEEALKLMPDVVTKSVENQYRNRNVVETFYQKHPKLRQPYIQNMVASIAEDIESKNPHLSVDEIFNRTADETYKIIGKQEVKKEPAFSNSVKGTREQKINKSTMQSQIDSMLKSVG